MICYKRHTSWLIYTRIMIINNIWHNETTNKPSCWDFPMAPRTEVIWLPLGLSWQPKKPCLRCQKNTVLKWCSLMGVGGHLLVAVERHISFMHHKAHPLPTMPLSWPFRGKPFQPTLETPNQLNTTLNNCSAPGYPVGSIPSSPVGIVAAKIC